MDLNHLSALRSHELKAVLQLLEKYGMNSGQLLEIGAGTGHQALMLAERGYKVSAIDLPKSRYTPSRVWPVIDYDGLKIPFPDQSFEVIFSSNVLEHIIDIDQIQQEIYRVLAPGGLVIHVLPSPTWRILTMLVHYPWLATAMTQSLTYKLKPKNQKTTNPSPQKPTVRSDFFRRILYANRHGEHGNALTEAYQFRSKRWLNNFKKNSFQAVEILESGLIYSGYALLGSRLSISSRKKLASLLGSACNIFVLRHQAEEIPKK